MQLKSIAYTKVAAFMFWLPFSNVQAQEKPAEPVVQKELKLPDPTTYEAFYDVKIGMYYVYPKIGDIISGTPIVMSPQEYQKYRMWNASKDYYREKSDQYNALFRKSAASTRKKGLIPALNVKNKLFELIFGGNKIEIIPSGFASFDLGGLYQKIDNPLILPQNRTSFAFDIEQRIQLGLLGKVGENLQLRANYDTQSGFAFENRMNVAWLSKGSWKDLQSKGLNAPGAGSEDRFIKKVEFGNINLPLSTSLIRGSEALFGVKAEFQAGKTFGTVVLSQQQGEARNIVVQGGGVMNSFKINAVDYEDNQHYFLGHYFHDNYDTALQNYPVINSAININRIEVWVLDQGNTNLSAQKSIIGVRDLGEGAGMPNNAQSNVYDAITGLGAGLRDVNTAYNLLQGQSLPTSGGALQTYKDGEHFIFNRKARRLSESEYKFNSQLGYLSLTQRLNDNQLLAVSYSYTVNGSNQVYKVGEFSEESPVLITKVLKPNTNVTPSSPMWKLMMKNVYSLDGMQINSENFMLNVYYRDPKSGGKLNYLPDTPVQDTNLLKLLNWDRLNLHNDTQNNNGVLGDGLFDFVPNITIRPEEGKVMFTKVQPFGSFMETTLGSNNPQYVFRDLYEQQKQVATQSNLAQRYTIEGRYKGTQGQGISLGAINVPQGSVKVTANGIQLVEGVDYTVNYMLGQVNIINEQVRQSGQAINISLENRLTFNTQRKRFMGVNLEHRFNDKFILGGTVVNYSEMPLTQKVNYGQEAVNNTMAGMNILYANKAPFLTRLTDKIPLINTEAQSNINFRMEAAYLLPSLNSATNNESYIDDFEQTTSKISLKEPTAWALASKPEKNQSDPIFSGAGQNNNLQNGYGRGLLSWYYIDPRFWGVGGTAPQGIDANAVSNHASRRVRVQELFNTRDLVAGEQVFTNTLDLSFFPQERGPYNVNPNNEAPESRWGGMMRAINVSNFTNSNIEYIEFWMMDPYADGKQLGNNPRLLLQLGNVSEDILKDGQLQYENGLPTATQPNSTTNTNWGVQPKQAPIVYAFANQGDERLGQDLGFDGLDSAGEALKFNTNFVNPVTGKSDPANDDFVFYLSNQFQGTQGSSVTERYKYFRNPEGNSKSNSLEVASQTPDAEDVNRDYNLDQAENYNQYEVRLDQNSLAVGMNNHIVDVKTVPVTFMNGNTSTVKWYLVRIPVSGYVSNAGDADPAILNNVRFARLLLTGFNQAATLRLGTFDLIRSDWRKYTKNISSNTVASNQEGVGAPLDGNKDFEVGSVNLEENGLNQPPYVLPPGIVRQVLSGPAGAERQNEASLYLRARNLRNEARGVFKNTNLDMRRFGKLKLFVHAHSNSLRDNGKFDPTSKFFIRFGSDTSDNYYEYESALQLTDRWATAPMDIWPLANEINLDVQNFVDAKIHRDKSGIAALERFHYANFGDQNKKIYIKGRPSLGNITTVMIGVRDDSGISGQPKDITLWVNEVRLSDVENKGGYAGNATLNFNLGDFAVVNTSAAYSSVGFGAINSRPSERAQSEQSALSVNTSVNVDKFLPEKSGVKIPLNYSYAQTIEDPKYNPLDNDVEFKKAPNREELKQIARTYTQQRSIGVVNMRKERSNTKKKQRFYDVENLSMSLVYNDDLYRDIYTKRNLRQYLRGNLDYNYTFKPWVIKPFEKMISDTAKSAKYLKWVKEFNFNPIPTRLSFRTELDRNYNELEFRNIDAILNGNAGSNFDVIRNRNFYFGWQYALGFNFTKSLKLEINSATRTLNDNMSVQNMNDKSIFQDAFRAGRPVLYNHRIQANYRLPFEHLPFLDFISSEIGYGMTYNWSARSTALLNSPQGSLGNMAQNTNNIVATASMDFPRLFGKIDYFKKISDKMNKRRREIDSLNTVYTNMWTKKRFRYKPYKFKTKISLGENIAYALTSFKNLDINYTQTSGTTLPGLLSSPNWMGYGQQIGGPTYGFLLGSQADIRRMVLENGWVSNSTLMTEPYMQTVNRNLTGTMQMTPLNNFRIDFNVLHNYVSTFSQSGYNSRLNLTRPNLDYAFGVDMVTHSNTVWMMPTSFSDGARIYQSIIENARAISQRMDTPMTSTGFRDGYGVGNAYVLIPAFEAAVEGKQPVGILNTPKKTRFPLPNWRIVYSGLRNVPIINAYFTKFDILHAYTATKTVTGIQSNIQYYNNVSRDANNNFVNPYTLTQMGYVEAFAPFIGFDVTMRNNMQFRANYNRDRMFMLGLVNNTLTEDSGVEYVVGFGYIVKNFRLGGMNFGRRGSKAKSDLNIRGDFQLRDNTTRISNLLLNDSQVTGGQRLMSIKLSADYSVSQNLNLRLFYDQMLTRYKISTAFPLSTIRAGISATFTFGGEASR